MSGGWCSPFPCAFRFPFLYFSLLFVGDFKVSSSATSPHLSSAASDDRLMTWKTSLGTAPPVIMPLG